MSGPFDQRLGLGADLLGLASCRPSPYGFAATLGVGDSSLQPSEAPVQTSSAANPGNQANPRLTDANVDLLGRVLTAECGPQVCSAQERQAIGSTVINRMNHRGTDDVAHVATKGQFAVANEADPDSLALARGLLSGQIGDNTNGAMNFYSPKSMPKEGQSTKGWDVHGGLEYVPGAGRKTTAKNYKPSWANVLEQRTIPGVSDWHVKVYGPPQDSEQ